MRHRRLVLLCVRFYKVNMQGVGGGVSLGRVFEYGWWNIVVLLGYFIRGGCSLEWVIISLVIKVTLLLLFPIYKVVPSFDSFILLS